MVTLDDLRNGPRRVRAAETNRVFMLSAVIHESGFVGVAGYEIGSMRPADSQHRLVAAGTRYDWFSRLVLD
ncbi:MAG: hypothetical protein PHE83_16590 [Opitutaceae bacterium]|nr:hypothetical protein [Opitutaceae bacterium]